MKPYARSKSALVYLVCSQLGSILAGIPKRAEMMACQDYALSAAELVSTYDGRQTLIGAALRHQGSMVALYRRTASSTSADGSA
jgi:hypothetical protein